MHSIPVKMMPSAQGESTRAGSTGSTVPAFYFVPYRFQENAGFAYEKVWGCCDLKKPRIIMYKYKYWMWSKCYASHL